MRLTISLTSIPPRFAGLGPTLESLCAQEGVAEVRLVLPRAHAAFPGPVVPPPLPGGVRLVWTKADLGPATKLMPTLQDTDGPILVCDDDWIYGPGWARGFLDAAREHPGAAIAASSYPASRLGVGSGTVVQGFAGVLVSRDMLPDAAYDPPGWARAVDDVWLSGMLAAAGTPVVTPPALRALCQPSGNEAAPLQSRTDRARLNRDCARAVRDRFGIW